jgi:hypothetical protein
VNRGAPKQDINVVSIRGIEKIQMAMTEGLVNVYTRLGRPEADLNSATFWLMMDNIVQVWHKVFPYEVKEFSETVKEQRANDRGFLSMSTPGIMNKYAIPAGLFKMIKAFYPYFQFTDDKFIKKMTDRYPFLKTTNSKL